MDKQQVVDDFSSDDKNNDGTAGHDALPATIQAVKERAEAQKRRQ
jgi:hypothetical protein